MAQGSAQAQADIARAFEEAVVETLMIKCRRALVQTGLQRLVVAGGVGANQPSAERLADHGRGRRHGIYLSAPGVLHR